MVSGIFSQMSCPVKKLLLLLVSIQFTVWTLAFGQKPTYTNDRPDLPRDHPYQQQLYEWLQSLKVDDFEIPKPEIIWDGTVHDPEHASRLWGFFGYGGPKPGTVIQAEPHWFVLDDRNGHGLVGSGQVRQPRWGNEAAVFYIMDLPLADGGQGNPYFHHKAVARRALVATAVDLMMTDDSHDKINSIARSDFLGGTMNGWLETYGHCHDLLDRKTQQAFEKGFERMLDKFLKWKARDVNTNMDMRAVASAARFYAISKDKHVREKCIRVARLFLFGFEDGSLEKLDSLTGTYYPAGYIAENEGPETTYNGVSYYHLVEARCAVIDAPKWDFLDPVLRAMTEFKLFQFFPDHEIYDGPAGYACRTGNSYVYDQRSRPWRDVAAADLYIEARPLIFSHQWKRPKLPEIAEISNRLKQQIRKLSAKLSAGSPETSPMVWEADHSHHWPPDSPFFSRPGWYERLKKIEKNGDPLNLIPYARPNHSFSRFFGSAGQEEFWAFRQDDTDHDYGFFIEHVPRTWPYGSWAGGSLQLFWTPKTGILILSTHDKAGDEFEKRENTRVYKVIDQWATDHVWGKTGGNSFTTATSFNHVAPEVTSNTEEKSPWVEAKTKFRDDRGEIHSPDTMVISKFEPLDSGLRVTKTLSGSPRADELWATIPVYLRNAQRHKDLADTTIEGWVDDAWKPLTTELQMTQRIRLGRDTGDGIAHAIIGFQSPESVKLSESPWQAAYQSRSRIRNIHIDLLNDPVVTYSISGGQP